MAVHDKRRLALSVAGIAFAVIIIFAELGFLNGLLDGQVEVLERLDGDAFIVSRRKVALAADLPFARRRITQALACPSVASVSPVWIAAEVAWRNPEDRSLHAVRVLGVDPEDGPSADPEVRSSLRRLELPDSALLDRRSREYIGPREEGVATELSRHRVNVAGTFELGTDFVFNGTVVTSERGYLSVRSDADPGAPSLARVELGVVKFREGVETNAGTAELGSLLPGDVQVLSRQDLEEVELAFWRANTPVGPIFALGTFMGFVVGVFICYQVLATEVLDHLPQIATLRALGHGDESVVRLVLEEALLLSVMGFAVGASLSVLLYGWIDGATGIHMRLTGTRCVLVLAIDVAMCSLSAVLASRRALRADPAEMFR
jgi:putative ABC transport system permease protein